MSRPRAIRNSVGERSHGTDLALHREVLLAGKYRKVSDEEIADVCCWPTRKARALIDALVTAGWLDREPPPLLGENKSLQKPLGSGYRLLVHDWPDHADSAVIKTLKNRHLEFIFPEKVGNGSADSGPRARERLGTARLSSNSSPREENSSTRASAKPEATNPPASRSAPANGTSGAAVTDPDLEFANWRREYEATGAPFIDADWTDAYAAWRHLDFEQKLAVVRGFRAQRFGGRWQDPTRVKKPGNYIRDREYERAVATARAGVSQTTRNVASNLKDMRGEHNAR